MANPEAQPSSIHLHSSDPGSSAVRIRPATALVAAATLIFACVATTHLEFKLRSAFMAMSNLPLVTLLPFVYWLLANAILKRFCPRLSLSAAELRVLFCVFWMGGLFAGYNWVTQWVGEMAAPRFFATPENRWAELIFDYIPWWMYPKNFPRVVDGFYLGLDEGEALPWGAWISPIFWAASAALAMTAIGLGLTAVFQKQWAQYERLTYPLAQVPLDLTEGFDRQRGWPPFMQSRAFWAGFGIAALPLLWNIVAYWLPEFPRMTIFERYEVGPRGLVLSRYLYPFSYRLLPTVIGFTFLCDLNILFSLWSLYLVGQAVLYGMYRIGFSVGLSGQEAGPAQIAGLFTHGVMIGLVIWTIWIARGHLKRIAQQILRPVENGKAETVILSPRGAAVTLLGGTVYMLFWLHRVGYGPAMALVWLGLFWASILTIMKFLAASGFAYMFPTWGASIPEIWLGANRISVSTSVAMRLVNWRTLAGWRLPPALPHVGKLMPSGRRIERLIFSSVLLGLLSAVAYTIWLCYTEGGSTFRTWSLVGAPRGVYNGISSMVAETHRSISDPEKIAVWILGGAAAAVAMILQTRLPWWPVHPLGLMLMYNGYVRLYFLNIFLVWLAKLLILRFGGIGLYRRAKPCFYGLIVGYVFAAGCSFGVDFIWFPQGGHLIHDY